MTKKRKRRIGLWIIAMIILLLLVFVVYFKIATSISPPTEMDPLNMGYERTEVSPGVYTSEQNWLKKNSYGLWELSLTGDPLELGVRNGLLTAELIREQEEAFVAQIEKMIPSRAYLRFLKYFIAWFNRDLEDHISREYLLEIYGVSAFASTDFDFIGPNYDRILNYHAAHDIGHALQNMNLVECTAFGVWDARTTDSALLIGRNFDFHVGDEFAENKILAFVDPEQGYRFASITWGGMTGVVSGMNEKGLCITLNSAKSDIPYGAKTPVSIIAREILQYASTIDEAMSIASARESFVSESFLIGSARDHKTVVIEKSTEQTVLYDPDTNFIILTNHFQSDPLINTPLNRENMDNKTSVYRHERVQELLEANPVIDQREAAAILRNRKGLNGQDIGNGNELAINQLIAHHAVIFEPEKLRIRVSTKPWQLGAFLCYDLERIFNSGLTDTSTYNEQELIPDDTFLDDPSYDKFLLFKDIGEKIKQAAKAQEPLKNEQTLVNSFIGSNPEYYHTYVILGKYYQALEQYETAINYYTIALTKEVASKVEMENITGWLEECRKH